MQTCYKRLAGQLESDQEYITEKEKTKVGKLKLEIWKNTYLEHDRVPALVTTIAIGEKGVHMRVVDHNRHRLLYHVDGSTEMYNTV